MFDQSKRGKIKNDKIMHWRTELSCYGFNIQYRPGKENVVADCLSHDTVYSCSTLNSSENLLDLHKALCHPGVTQMIHFIRARNLPYQVNDVKKITKSCKDYCKLKPQFHKPPVSHLIKATRPFECLNIDFKGPVPSTTNNVYMLTLVDEFSRFPLAFPCKDTSTETIKKCLLQLFSLLGMPNYVQSHRGSSLIADKLHNYLLSYNVARSRSTPYNPYGNGQVECYNGIIWKTVNLALSS